MLAASSTERTKRPDSGTLSSREMEDIVLYKPHLQRLIVFGESPTSHFGNFLVKKPTSDTRNASSTIPTQHRKRQVETYPTPAPKRRREQSTDHLASPVENHLFGQHIDLGPVETTLSHRPGRPMLETIKAFADLTPQTLDLIVKNYHGRVVFPNLKVDPEEFRSLERAYPGEENPSFEYDADNKKVTLLAPATPLHQKVEMAMQAWLEEVGDEISHGQDAYGCVTQYEVQLTDGSTKVPDVVILPQKSGSYPLVAVEVGFTESLEKLYEDAERLIKGSGGAVETVILVDLEERDVYRGHDPPWGQDPQTLGSKTRNELSTIIEAWFISQGLRIIGKLVGKVFIYPKQRKTRPRVPIHTINYDPDTHQVTSTSKHPTPKVTIKSQKFALPMRKLESAVKQGVLFEKNRRIIRMIEKAGLLS